MPRRAQAAIAEKEYQTTELAELFEPATDQMRRTWSENHGDWAHGLLNFLRGDRENEIGLSEIETTKLYANSTLLEQSSLRFVAAQAEQPALLTAEDEKILRERDNFIMAYGNGTATGPEEWIAQLAGIPEDVQRAKALDVVLFPRAKQFPMRRIFGWIFNGPKA